jgi:prevent-host-death family protein
MRAAGIREIKNKLSEYLRLVRDGETILVTDRGVVVAQLAPPPPAGAPALAEDAALARLAAAGKLRLPRNKVPSPRQGPISDLPSGIDVERALGEVRGDRDRS